MFFKLFQELRAVWRLKLWKTISYRKTWLLEIIEHIKDTCAAQSYQFSFINVL